MQNWFLKKIIKEFLHCILKQKMTPFSAFMSKYIVQLIMVIELSGEPFGV